MNIEVDEQDKVLGLRTRSDFYGGRLIHRASHLIIQNPIMEILLQKRARTKRWYPGLWEYTVSETVKDETYEEAMKRGVKEELGVSIPLNELFKYFTSDEGTDKAWRAVFLAVTSQREFPFDKREIEEMRWFSQDELKRNIAQNSSNYTPHLITGLERFFEI